MPDAKPNATIDETVERVPRGRDRRNLSPGSPAMLQKHVWAAIRRCSDILDDAASPPELVLRAAHAIAGAANSWSRIHEQHVLAQQVDELRKVVDQLVADRGGHRR